MIISRRQFLKYCSVAAGAIGLTATDLMKLEKAMALTGGLRTVWINGQACSGCTVSLANSVYYQTIQELTLLNDSALSMDLLYNETLMGAQGLPGTSQTFNNTTFVLAIEGAIPTGIAAPNAGMYCQAGDFSASGATTEAMKDTIIALASHTHCAAVLCMGTCAAFGGIPAAAGNVTGAKGFLDFWADHIGTTITSTYRDVRAKTVNIPGCPPNPNWMVGTIAYVISRLTEGVKLPSLDALRRPRLYYGERICNYCDRFPTSLGSGIGSNANQFVGVNPTLTYNRLTVNEPDRIGDPDQNAPSSRCLKLAGCKGSRTKSDCSVRKWHSPGYAQIGDNWCVGAGAPCQGCTQNFFPDRMSPFHYIR
jgi:hydrogenase small subunit